MGQSGKLTINREGITIERNFAQAARERSKRVTHLSFAEIESLKHRYAADKPGFLELKSASGSGEVANLNRRHRIHFDAQSAHRFRRAKRQILSRMQDQSAVGAHSVANHGPQVNSLETHPRGVSLHRNLPSLIDASPSQTPQHPIKQLTSDHLPYRISRLKPT